MKRLSIYFLLVISCCALCLSFTSCDEDAFISYQLSGTWKGTTRAGRGQIYTTTIRFFQEDNYGGYGYEYDRKGWGEAYAEFEWAIRRGNIYLWYDDGFEAIIRDYELRDGIMYGYIDDQRSGWTQAEISWTKIDNDYDKGYFSWQNRYYSPKK